MNFIGPPLRDSFKKYYLLSEGKTSEAVNYYKEYFAKHGMFEYVVYPGIPELLEKLNKKGKKLYVATSKSTFLSEKVVKYLDLDKYFTKIIGGNLDGTNSSKTEVIKQVIKFHTKENRRSFLMVGDKEHDIIGAKDSGIDSIGVSFGYGSFDELKKANPTYLVNSVSDLESSIL